MCSLPRHAVPLTKRRRGGRGTSAAGEASLLHLLDLPPGAHGFEGPLEAGEKQQDPCPLGLEVAGHFHTRLVTQKHPATRAAPAQPRKDRRPGPAEARVLAMKDAWLAHAGLGFAANESSFGRSPLPVIDANPGSCPGLWAAPTPPPPSVPCGPREHVLRPSHFGVFWVSSRLPGIPLVPGRRQPNPLTLLGPGSLRYEAEIVTTLFFLLFLQAP